MPGIEIDLNPVDFVTIDTIGPKGQRVFYLQAGQGGQLVSLVIEKEQSWALSEAINDFMDELEKEQVQADAVDISVMDMALREPIQPLFRVAQMALGYDSDSGLVILIAQELTLNSGIDLDDDDSDDFDNEPGVVRMWCTAEQIRALSLQAIDTVQSGRADPRQNGRLVYYWT